MPLWEAFYIENDRSDLDTLRVPNRSPTPILKSSDFLGQSGDIWGARGPHFRPILGVPGVRAGLKNTYFVSLLKRPLRTTSTGRPYVERLQHSERVDVVVGARYVIGVVWVDPGPPV